jgi:predicted GIY-YIG superfamily endonuclease
MIKIKIAGIYKVTNKITEQYYIGMSKDIMSRWQNHWTDIKMNKHSSTEFLELMKSGSIEDWTFEIIKYISTTELKKESNLKGKAFETYLRTKLLQEERSIMKQYSKTFCLNKDKKYFS